MSKYVIKEFYPSLPDTFLPGTILFRYSPIVGFAYYSDMHDQQRLKKEEVENHPTFFEKL